MSNAVYKKSDADLAWLEICGRQEELPEYNFSRGDGGIKHPASAFHIQEVMRHVLRNLPDPNDDEGHHSQRIISKFGLKCLYADIIFRGWWDQLDRFRTSRENSNDSENISHAVAGGATQNILRRMLGVKITSSNRWRPARNFSLIGPVSSPDGSDYYIIDDIASTFDWCQEVGSENLVINLQTGLRLTKEVPENAMLNSIDSFLGTNHRFKSAEDWIRWLYERPSELGHDWKTLDEYLEPLVGQGKDYYFTCPPKPNDILRHQSGTTSRQGPANSDWWHEMSHCESLPCLNIDGERVLFGARWRLDDEDERYNSWKPIRFHMLNLDTRRVLEINITTLGLETRYAGNQNGRAIYRSSTNNKKNTTLMERIRHMSFRSTQVVFTENGLGRKLNIEDSIRGVGVEGSRIDSPYSEMYLIKRNDLEPGLFHGSPIIDTMTRKVLELNWWSLEP